MGSVGEQVRVAPWWRAAPLDRVVRLEGGSFRDLAESVDPLPADAPAIVFFTVDAAGTTSAVVDRILAALEVAAVALVPRWLPESDTPPESSSLDRRAAQVRARELASHSEHFGPYLALLADAAIGSRVVDPDAFSRETRAEGCARVIAAGYGRTRTALVIDGKTLDPVVSATVAEWLCANGRIGVWVLSTDTDRFPTVRASVPAVPAGADTIVDKFRPLSFPPIEGHPHPGSPSENRLCDLLSTREWATGREHNRGLRLSDMTPTFTIDVLWRGEKVIVELDGDDHRAQAKFSADRARDNQLQTHGYIVLRFTNEQVITDHGLVLAMIEQALNRRRKGTKVEFDGSDG